MNHYVTNLIIVGCIVLVILLGCIIDTAAYSYCDRTSSVWSSDDLWNELLEKKRTNAIINHLRENGWVANGVNDDELDYILTMTDQIAGMYENVRPELVMATIAVESHYNNDCGSDAGALGLMQIIPTYHKDRVLKFVEKDIPYSKDLFLTPRLNIACGIDYISELLEQSDGGEALALMQYNQGPYSANRTYNRGVVTSYAKRVLKLAEDISVFLNVRPTLH